MFALRRFSILEWGLFAVVLIEMLILAFKENSLRNSQLLIDAGENIFNRESAYATPNPYGPFPSLMYKIISFITHTENSPYVFITLNLAGCILLMRFLFQSLNLANFLTLLSVLFLTSPIRALTTNVQHLGVILGSSILAIMTYEKYRKFPKKRYLFLASFLFSFALEFKLQTVAPLVAIYVFQKRSMKLGLSIVAVSVVERLAIDIWTMKFLEREQLQVWKIMRTDTLALKEQISPWKVLGFLTNDSIDWFKISFILTLLLILIGILLATRSNHNYVLYLGIFIPLSSSYVHYYDVIPLVGILVYLLLRNNQINGIGIMFGLSLLTLPTHFGSHVNLSEIGLLICLNLILAISQRLHLRVVVRRLVESGLALVAVDICSSHFSQLEVGLSVLLTLSMIVVAPECFKKLGFLLLNLKKLS